MKDPQRALLIVGSLRKPRSTSEALGSYLLDRLLERGWSGEILGLKPSMLTEHGRGELFSAVERADLLVLAFPLYVDSLPALLTGALELIAMERQGKASLRPQRLLAIVNNGFPEAQQNATALAICRRFAAETGIQWAGGLALGGGGVISGQPLTTMGGMLRHVVRALDDAAEALAEGRPVPEEAAESMAKPLMPKWLYIAIGDLGWIQQAWRNGALLKINSRPLEAR